MQEHSVQTPRSTHRQPKNLKKTNRFPSYLLDGTSVAKHSGETPSALLCCWAMAGLDPRAVNSFQEVRQWVFSQ
jgi:hypothetical protein